MYSHVKPVSSASRYVMNGSNSRKPEGTQLRLIGVVDRRTRAVRTKTNSPPLVQKEIKIKQGPK